MKGLSIPARDPLLPLSLRPSMRVERSPFECRSEDWVRDGLDCIMRSIIWERVDTSAAR